MHEKETLLKRINKYIEDNEMHKDIVYCFNDKELKESLRPYLPQPLGREEYTEILVNKDTLSHTNSPIFIYGEYKKFSREMTQSPLKIKGKLKCERSVSDFVKQIKEIYGAKAVVFIPSGREDIDVMNLGGRPFLLKIKEPTRNLQTKSLTLEIYPEIYLFNFKKVKQKAKEHILEGERNKKKVYQCTIVCKNILDIDEYYEIKQKTPLRVLHRRANLVRERVVEILRAEEWKEDDLWAYKIDLKASAGTYIKEFVNGDFGRTTPSLSSNGSYADLIYLDVLKIESNALPCDLVEWEFKLKIIFN